MPEFRKKPVVIEARRLHPKANVGHLLAWILDNGGDAVIRGGPKGGSRGGTLLITTLEGVMHADIGDWIIKGVAGEFYPCKPDIFGATYEPVPAPPTSEGTPDAE